jgi:hypothetical protein
MRVVSQVNLIYEMSSIQSAHRKIAHDASNFAHENIEML